MYLIEALRCNLRLSPRRLLQTNDQPMSRVKGRRLQSTTYTKIDMYVNDYA
jgi:hypothetical protein